MRQHSPALPHDVWMQCDLNCSLTSQLKSGSGIAFKTDMTARARPNRSINGRDDPTYLADGVGAGQATYRYRIPNRVQIYTFQLASPGRFAVHFGNRP
ncbi:hypothetical protein IF1G_00917 [Cordyceps javanica]|uniref:Uncharacterized protein n=1 Tax=Cordyceps javanica TaxID=43265 RepID=A0A545VGZ7_9HYPO|nr:hypothetical protein IF1G_00917 [Cordyceps javanica]